MLDFRTRLLWLNIEVEDIMKIGYSRRTAYAWLEGSRKPREQMQDHIIEELQKVKKAKEVKLYDPSVSRIYN